MIRTTLVLCVATMISMTSGLKSYTASSITNEIHENKALIQTTSEALFGSSDHKFA